MINGQTAPIITLWALLYSRDCARNTCRRNRSGARNTGAVFLCLITHSDGQHYKKESENAYDEVRNCQRCIIENEIDTPSITASK